MQYVLGQLIVIFNCYTCLSESSNHNAYLSTCNFATLHRRTGSKHEP